MCQGPSSPAVNGGSAVCGIPHSYSVPIGEGMEGGHQPHWVNLYGTGHKPHKLDSLRVALSPGMEGVLETCWSDGRAIT